MNFYLILLSILFTLLLFDVYFLISFRNFILRNSYNKAFYRILISFSIIGFIIIIINIFNRTYNFEYSVINWWAWAIISLWYLPKLIIIPFVFIKDLITLIVKLIRKKKSKFLLINSKLNKKLQIIGWLIILIPFLIVAKSIFYNSQNIIVKNIEVSSKNDWLKGLKIVHISDIHASSLRNSNIMLKEAKRINELNPDLILITGDFVSNDPEEMKNIQEGLKYLKAKYGKFGILGNHDHYMSDENLSKLIPAIKSTGIDLLINEHRKIEFNNKIINIAGVDDLSFSNNFGDYDKALFGIDTNEYIIMLAHNPSNWKEYNLVNRGVDFTFSGHTHGGQVLFDFLFCKIVPGEYAYDELMGLYHNNGKYIYVNPGFGTTGPPIRIGIPPEISLITFK